MECERDQRGSTLPLIVGFTLVLALVIAFVVDATAAYLRRSHLETLADGAALQGADLGIDAASLYENGIGATTLQVTAAAARRAISAYLADVKAAASYPGLAYTVSVDSTHQRVTVKLTAPLRLPLNVPGAPRQPGISATGSASVALDE